PYVFLCRPKRDIHNQSTLLGNHHRRDQLTSAVVCANAGCEHSIPAPQRLLPEWFGPGESAMLDHVLITAPNVIDQDINGLGLARELLKSRVLLRCLPMVAPNPDNLVLQRFMVINRTAGDKNPRSFSSELASDSAAHTFRGASDYCDFSA